jgi:hypothetical protein
LPEQHSSSSPHWQVFAVRQSLPQHTLHGPSHVKQQVLPLSPQQFWPNSPVPQQHTPLQQG